MRISLLTYSTQIAIYKLKIKKNNRGDYINNNNNNNKDNI